MGYGHGCGHGFGCHCTGCAAGLGELQRVWDVSPLWRLPLAIVAVKAIWVHSEPFEICFIGGDRWGQVVVGLLEV
eukprot:356456-Chlamydomonas_euryale.AAC.9